MMKPAKGLVVIRKRDGATATIVGRSEMFTRGVRFPFKTIVEVLLDDEALRLRAGGTMSGDLGWLRSEFKEAK